MSRRLVVHLRAHGAPPASADPLYVPPLPVDQLRVMDAGAAVRALMATGMPAAEATARMGTAMREAAQAVADFNAAMGRAEAVIRERRTKLARGLGYGR